MDREAVEKLSRQSPEISMDQDCANFCWVKKKEGLDRSEFVEDLSRSCRAWRKEVFQGGKTHKDECNKQATQTRIQSTCPKHTHTHNKQV